MSSTILSWKQWKCWYSENYVASFQHYYLSSQRPKLCSTGQKEIESDSKVFFEHEYYLYITYFTWVSKANLFLYECSLNHFFLLFTHTFLFFIPLLNLPSLAATRWRRPRGRARARWREPRWPPGTRTPPAQSHLGRRRWSGLKRRSTGMSSAAS